LEKHSNTQCLLVISIILREFNREYFLSIREIIELLQGKFASNFKTFPNYFQLNSTKISGTLKWG
jgi:hypothetical protein